MEEKKKRGCNYTPAEKHVLLELIKKYQDIIENKETNANIILKKRQAWDTVCQQYNTVAVSGYRTWQQLRHLYENLKQRSKKNIAKAKRLQFYENIKELQKKLSIDENEINHTTAAGGTYENVLSEQDAHILAMAEPEVTETNTDSEVISSLSSSAINETMDYQDTTMAYMSIAELADHSKPCTVTSINIADDQPAAMVIKPQEKNQPLRSSSAGRLKPTFITMRQQYFRTKLRNAKLKTKYLINKNKMEMNKYKIEMQFWKLRIEKLKSKLQ